MQTPTRDTLAAAMMAKGFAIFTDEFDMNMFLLRAVPGKLDTFDDIYGMFWVEKKVWRMETWAATADPGKPSLVHPKRSDGTAQMDLGQHRGAFTFGLHHGKRDHPCYVPVSTIPVRRFKSEADFAAGVYTLSTSNSTQIHHASSYHPSTIVGAYSEGCAVTAAKASLDRALELGHKQEAAGHGNRLSLSVLEWAA